MTSELTTQTWRIPVSPAQRMVLLHLALHDGQKMQGQQGRVFRRCMRAFALDRLRDALVAHQNRYDARIHAATTPALFEITAESLEYALKLAEVEHGPIDEMVVGPLFDALEDAKAGREVLIPEGSVAFDPSTDDWAPKGPISTLDPVEVAAKRIEDLLRRSGEERAAELVARGQWDTPEPAAQSAAGLADA